MIFLCILAHSDKKYKIITWTTGILLFASIVLSILICCFGEVKTSYTRCELKNVSVNSEMVRDGEYITIRADKYKIVKSSDHISRIGLEKITGPAPSFLRQNLAHHVKVNKENDDIFLDRTCEYKKLGIF